jgi:hypothetical protein
VANNSHSTIIRIAGIDIPVHLAWDKIEALNTGAEILQRLNQKYPHLASEFTHEIVPIVRKRITECLGDIKPPPKKDDDLVGYLLEKMSTDCPLDIIDSAQRDKGIELSLEDLVYLVGEKSYMQAMNRQAWEFYENKILPEQVADLWNQAHMPAPGKAHWTKRDIEKMLGIQESSGWS